MGRHFGDLAVIRGIIYYKLSPHEQKPFATAFVHGLPNFVPRTLSNMYAWLPMFLFGYVTFVMVDDAYHESKRKSPFKFNYETPPPPVEGDPCQARVLDTDDKK